MISNTFYLVKSYNEIDRKEYSNMLQETIDLSLKGSSLGIPVNFLKFVVNFKEINKAADYYVSNVLYLDNRYK